MEELKAPIENHCCKAMEHCETTSISKRRINGQDRWMWEQTQKNGYIAANEIMFCPYCGVELNRRAEPKNSPEQKGMYEKYHVTKNADGSEIQNCFVMRPDKDSAAITAMRTYAQVTPNKALSEDIYNWVGRAEPENKALTCDGCALEKEYPMTSTCQNCSRRYADYYAHQPEGSEIP